jgi:hypothetical protein
MERIWNALALGGVVGALLATAGVVNLGDLPSWPSFSMTPTTSPAVTAQGSEEAVRAAFTQPTPVEQATLPEHPAADVTVQVFEVQSASSEPAAPASDPAPTPLHATLTTPDGPNPTLRAHDEIKALLLTTTDAYAYCYYADGNGTISRIFPNRFQPDALVRSGALQLPDSTGAFTLVADKPGRTEEVRCMAATSDLGSKLPTVLQAEDLVPLAVRSLNEISGIFHSLGEEVVETRLVAEVLPEATRSTSLDTFAAASY